MKQANHVPLELKFSNHYQTVMSLRDEGYEPIECAFGQYGSVMGPLNMDHHGEESHREGVALRACRDLYGARVHDPRFAVTGTPDADAVLAIIALAGLVPKHRLDPEFYTLVNRYDTDPIGIDLFTEPSGLGLAWFNQVTHLTQSEEGFRRGIDAMVSLLTEGVTDSDADRIRRADENRKKRAKEGIVSLFGRRGESLDIPEFVEGQPVLRGSKALSGTARVLVVESSVWGFDVWYRYAPVVVSYASRIKKVTVGCPDVDTAERLFGPGGLKNAWSVLGRGWGGRESIGGSPRGEEKTRNDASLTALELSRHLRPS